MSLAGDIRVVIVCWGHLSVQNIVGLDDGLAPDQHQAMTQHNCVIYTFLVINILSFPSGLGYLDYYEFLII